MILLRVWSRCCGRPCRCLRLPRFTHPSRRRRRGPDNGREAEGHAERLHHRRGPVQGHVRQGGGRGRQGKGGPQRLADDRVHRGKSELRSSSLGSRLRLG